MKRIIALVLSLVMALSLCAPAYAEGETVITTQDDFAKAIADGETTITLGEGTYQMPAAAKGKTLTISGTEAAKTIIEVVPAGQGEANGQLDYNLDGSTVTFNDLTIKTNSQLYAGYARLSATYNDCIIQNTYNLGTGNSEFNRCVFNITNEYLRVGGAYSAVFNGCTFNTDGRAILVFQDGTSVAQTVTVKDCTFNATAAAYTWDKKHVSAVSIDGTNGTYTVNLEGNNVVDSDFNDLWQIKTGEKNVTVLENGVMAGAVATVNGKPYKSLQEAVNVGGKVVLLDNITLTESVTVPAGKTVELDLAGKTISQKKECTESYAMITNKGDLTITGNGKITMNDSGVNSGSSWGVYTIRNEGGKLIVENGTIENIAPNSTGNVNNAIFNYSGETTINNGVFSVPYSRTVRVWNGSVTINDGSFDGQVWAQPVNNNGCSLTINGGSFKPATNGNDGSSVYVTNGTYSVTVSVTDGYFATRIGMQAALKCISGGYFTTDPSAYCIENMTGVTSDKAGYLYMVGEEGANAAEIKPADPEVVVDTKNMTTAEKNIAETLDDAGAVTLDNAALVAEVKDVANENTVTEETGKEKLEAANVTVNRGDNITIVVQPYYDVEIKDVDVVETAGGQTSSVTIELDITPMYQTVATTATNLNDIDLEGNDKNAVVIGTAKEMTVTEPVNITIKIPSALVSLATENKLFVTHEASSGTYVYEATVNAQAGTATFTNTHGFSSFSISATDNTAATVQGGDKYTNLQDAINNAGKDAVIEMKKDGQSAVVKSETTFTVLATVQPTISAGSGYTMTKENVTGGVKYTFTKVTGGYYPYYPSTTPDSELVKSPDTFDAGIALYVGVSVMGAIGTVVLGKKRED